MPPTGMMPPMSDPMMGMGGMGMDPMMGMMPPQSPPNLVHMIAEGGPAANQILAVLMQALQAGQQSPMGGAPGGAGMSPMLMALMGGGGGMMPPMGGGGY